MIYLEQNLKGICERNGLDYSEFLEELDVEEANDLSIYDLEAISEEYEIDLHALLFTHTFKTEAMRLQLDKIKLVVLDVDGVMTDGGMYYTEKGDFIKKYNAKDGMAIMALMKQGIEVAIISSGTYGEAVLKRAQTLGIQHCTVNKEPKLTRLEKLCASLQLTYDEVCLIGDDVNDLEAMRVCGFTACPHDAVQQVKNSVNLVLSKNGGAGCIREFVDEYLLNQPLN